MIKEYVNRIMNLTRYATSASELDIFQYSFNLHLLFYYVRVTFLRIKYKSFLDASYFSVPQTSIVS